MFLYRPLPVVSQSRRGVDKVHPSMFLWSSPPLGFSITPVYIHSLNPWFVHFVLLNQNDIYILGRVYPTPRKELKTRPREGAPNFSKILFTFHLNFSTQFSMMLINHQKGFRGGLTVRLNQSHGCAAWWMDFVSPMWFDEDSRETGLCCALVQLNTSVNVGLKRYHKTLTESSIKERKKDGTKQVNYTP